MFTCAIIKQLFLDLEVGCLDVCTDEQLVFSEFKNVVFNNFFVKVQICHCCLHIQTSHYIIKFSFMLILSQPVIRYGVMQSTPAHRIIVPLYKSPISCSYLLNVKCAMIVCVTGPCNALFHF